ncbi:MAG: hypothetical protein GYB31_07655 [Bacteroidetes bacterium]|nr:hypothetical protein [Bacteroidota bacterium]
MSNSKDFDADFCDSMPNETGLPADNDRSSDIRKEHNRWKKEVKARKKDEKTEKQSYWQQQSSTVYL